MKAIFIGCLCAVLIPALCPAEGSSDRLKTETERINYSIGYQIGGDFQQQGWELHPELLVKGIQDAITHADPMISPEQMNTTLVKMKKRLVAEQRRASVQEDSAFLAKNARTDGVIVLPDGVQYKVIKEGTGRKPNLNDSVTIRYHVNRADGQFISTGYPNSDPKTYPLKKAIPGLQEVLQLMKEGSVWEVVIPPGPATASRGEILEMAGVLIYQLELVSVQPGK